MTVISPGDTCCSSFASRKADYFLQVFLLGRGKRLSPPALFWIVCCQRVVGTSHFCETTMKVTVTFGDTAVVVPCKDGWMVRDLIDQATCRYRKILQQVQHGEYVVRTHHVEYGEGGILDMDDPISDLLEDKDRLVAVFEEIPRGKASSPGSSVSSNGRASPTPSLDSLQYNTHFMTQQPIRAEIEVNEAVLKSNTPLLVRSSSDSLLAPPLEVMAPPPHDDLRAPDTDVNYILKGALDRTRQDQPAGKMPKINFSPLTKTVEFSGDQGPLGIHVVPYNSSLSGRSLGLHIKGIEANSRSRRDEIFLVDECIVQINDTPLLDKTFAESQEAFRQVLGSSLVRLEVLPLANKPRYEKSLIGQLFNGEAQPGPSPATNSPLLLRTTTAAAAAATAAGQPSGSSTTAVRSEAKPPPPKPQVRPKTPDPALDPLHPVTGPRGGPPSAGRAPRATPTPPLPAVGPRSLSPPPVAGPRGGPPSAGRAPSTSLTPPVTALRSQSPAPVTGPRGGPPSTGRAPRATPTPPLPAVGPRGQSPPPVKGPAGAGPRKAGKRINIELQKGSEGLGFTVVTRDSAAHGPGPILVKNILPRGAAIRDGRLQPGDRIMEVNGVDMTERTQEELVGMLRSTKQGESVFVVVARPEEVFLPRELKGEESPASGALVQEDGWEQLVYEVPLNDTGSAGLGVSLKGNRSRETGEDLGIFIKSIIHGGAAHKDGRLRVNDQLLAVNGEPLLGRSNHTAMETLRRSMSSEGNARGTIQLVLLRSAAQTVTSQSAGRANAGAANDYQDANPHTANQAHEEPAALQTRGPEGPPAATHRQGPQRGASPYLGPPASELNAGRAGQPLPVSDGFTYGRPAEAGYFPQTANGGRYDDDFDDEEEELTQGFPPPPSPRAVAEINRQLPPTPHSEDENGSLEEDLTYRWPDRDPDLLSPRSRASKSMDLVADESNVGSLVGPGQEPRDGGALGPTLGLWKSSSLESLQTAMSEAQQKRSRDAVPFHRPPPAVVRGRACNQSFRLAIDKSYEGPSEDDDDLSEQSSGRDTAASGSSRQELDADNDKKKKKKTKGKKKEKKTKGKKKADEASEDTEKKSKKLGFGLLRFGRKKEDKNKETSKALKKKMEALSEEEVDRDPRSVRPTPEGSLHSIQDIEDDDSDPNYARINFNTSPSPRTTSFPPPLAPEAPHSAPSGPYRPPDDLEGLYAKVNKPHHQALSESEPPRHQGQQRRENQPARPAPAYEELDLVRRRGPEPDPPRMAPRGADSRPAPPYDDLDRQPTTNTRRTDPYDYPTHSRPVPRDPASYSGGYPSHDPPPAPQAQRGRQPEAYHQYHTAPRPGKQQYRQTRQDAPPYQPSRGGNNNHNYESVGELQRSASRDASPERYPPPGYGDPDHYGDKDRYGNPERYAGNDRYAREDRSGDRKRSASTERYVEPDQYARTDRYGNRERSASTERYASTEPYGYRDEGRRPDPRQKNPLIGAV